MYLVKQIMNTRIYSIDSLRAIAMTMVIAQHSGLLPFGWTGVWLFYVISGFVISRNFIEEKATLKPAPADHYLSFFIRRIFRIVPPYAAYIALCLVAALALGLPLRLSELPYLASFTYNWRMIFATAPLLPTFGHLWTISVEEQFYLFFPLLMLGLRRERAIIGLVAIVALGPVLRNFLALYFSSAFSSDPERTAFGVYASSVGQFDAFALGSLLAHFEGHIRKAPQIAARLAWLAVLVSLAYIVTYIGINILVGAHGKDIIRNVVSGILYGQKREVFIYVAVDFCAAAIIAGAIAGWRIFRFLEAPMLVSVGQASYGGYLLHPIALMTAAYIFGIPNVDEPVFIRILIFVMAWCCTVALARTSYLKFERQFVRVGHRISSRILLRAQGSAVK
jgi:peptidoglycan/LPS O-acetylase OafA/YrhL